MTAQIGDKFYYEEQEYKLIAASGDFGFKPAKLGIRPVAHSTALWRGYIATYSITRSKFQLEALELFLDPKAQIPKIYGKEPCSGSAKDDLQITVFGKEGLYYGQLNHVLDFDGRIILGKDFIPAYYQHMGFQQPWAYEHVYEFIFEKGKLLETVDHSAKVENIRTSLVQGGDPFREFRGDMGWYIGNGFSTRLEDKAWWISDKRRDG